MLNNIIRIKPAAIDIRSVSFRVTIKTPSSAFRPFFLASPPCPFCNVKFPFAGTRRSRSSRNDRLAIDIRGYRSRRGRCVIPVGPQTEKVEIRGIASSVAPSRNSAVSKAERDTPGRVWVRRQQPGL